GGLRTYVAEGATVVTHESNKAFFEKTFRAPSTLVPDAQSKSPKPAPFQTVSDKWVHTDGKQSIEEYATQGELHTAALLVAYLPRSKVPVDAGAYRPGPTGTPPPSPAPPNAVNLLANIQRLKLNVATIAPIHGRGAVQFAEFRKFVGKS